jgi:oligoendopeptidase F
MQIDNIQLMAIIMQVLGVDGNFTDDEIEAIEEEAILLGIDDNGFKKVINLINKTEDAKDILKGIESFEEKLFTMQEIYKVLYSKNKISRLERKAAEWIRESFNLSDKVAKRLETIVKKMKKLSSELDALYSQCKI